MDLKFNLDYSFSMERVIDFISTRNALLLEESHYLHLIFNDTRSIITSRKCYAEYLNTELQLMSDSVITYKEFKYLPFDEWGCTYFWNDERIYFITQH